MPEQTEHGSFLTGFTIGLFAGAAGYFLFATDKGGKVRKSLAREWQEAQQSWLATEQVAGGTASLRDLARDFFSQILGTESPSAKKTASSKKATPTVHKKNTFKGV
jgi:gas vesicle protein